MSLTGSMMLQGCPPVDLLIRTSGEHRLSDFLLWQSQFALLVFSDTLWPDYSFWDLLQALVQYQRSYPHLQKLAALRQTCIHASDESCEQAAAQSQDARFGIAADDKMCEADVQGSARQLPVVRSDTDTSDSSVSSDSRPTSRSSSPMHSAQSQQHQQLQSQRHRLLQSHQQEQSSQEAAAHDAVVDSQHLRFWSDRFHMSSTSSDGANDAVQAHHVSRLDSVQSQTDSSLVHRTCPQLSQADDAQQQCHASDLIHCAPVGTDIQLLAETNCWNSVCFNKAKLI